MGKRTRWDVDLEDHYDAAEKLIANGFDITDTNCWITGYALTKFGYARVKIPGYPRYGPVVYVHRAMWAWDRGRLPSEDHVVAHKCGNGACANPKHLQSITWSKAFKNSEHHNAAKKTCPTCKKDDWLMQTRIRKGHAVIERCCRPCKNQYYEKYNTKRKTIIKTHGKRGKRLAEKLARNKKVKA
jgi:hypothetical protein